MCSSLGLKQANKPPITAPKIASETNIQTQRGHIEKQFFLATIGP
jgi:hypothetical protein